MYGVVWMACVNGAHMTEFLRMLGFNNFAFGLMAALPFAATFGQPIAAILIERTGLRKYQFIYCGTIHRLLWLVVAAIPLIIPLPSRSAVATMLIVVGLGWFLNALATPAWLTWMGDLIPRRIRGRHLATRMRVGRAVQILVVIALGATLDAVTNRSASISAEAQPVLLYAICAVFAAAALFGATDILLFRKIREVIPSQDIPRRPAVEIKFPAPQRRTLLSLGVYTGRCFAAGVHQLLLEPLKDRVFRHYVAYGATITFAMCVAGPFFMRNVLENLGFTKLGANSVYMVVGPIVGAVALKGWGKLIDRWGRRPVLILATVCTVFSIMPNFFAAPQTPSPRFVVSSGNRIGRRCRRERRLGRTCSSCSRS
jgi:MFS family permease